MGSVFAKIGIALQILASMEQVGMEVEHLKPGGEPEDVIIPEVHVSIHGQHFGLSGFRIRRI
jgi:hypothetical protein